VFRISRRLRRHCNRTRSIAFRQQRAKPLQRCHHAEEVDGNGAAPGAGNDSVQPAVTLRRDRIDHCSPACG
jgi:hypothetical protein